VRGAAPRAPSRAQVVAVQGDDLRPAVRALLQGVARRL